MNQILMAVARGARLQVRMVGQWSESPTYEAIRPRWTGDMRIHPDDEHLRFGPISTALRGYSEYPPAITEHFGTIERGYVNRLKYSDELYMYADELHRSLFLLILSEALAEEGL